MAEDEEQTVSPGNNTGDGIGVVNAVFLLVNAAAGAGLLNFPKSYKLAGGIIPSIIIQMALCLLALWGLITANVVAAEHQVVSMQELLESTCGRYFAVSAATIIFIYSVLCCTVYLVVIGDQFERVFLTLSGPKFCEKWYLNRDLAIICSSLIIILPNLFSKKMDFLKYVSRLGVLAIFYVGAMVTTEYFISNYKPNNEKNSVGKPDSSVHLYEVILSFATICYAYHCHVQSIAILGCLKDRSPKKIIIAVVAAFSIVSLLYASTGTFGYLTFGNDVKSNIILNYDPREPIVLLAFVLLALKICSSYPIVLFCGREACIDVTCVFTGIKRVDHDKKLRIGISTTLYLFTVLLALFIPNLGSILGLLGVFVATFIFVFPGMSQLFHGIKSEIRNDKHMILGILLISVGIILAIILCILSIYKLITINTETEKLCQA